ncbi:MAG TPA: DUF2933 domain-containing protein [Ideonella sp.]|uniref:DUF2933 domain-containing protein n=1 Tax=Ideonella sp. TaxID=1929293 RepID=UPI002E3330D4|nr:DUF2933 domain-containing protein [Ideonella sp.]HEX5683812.1 DUF2933 domain-containing protein [Ideonella sp.]
MSNHRFHTDPAGGRSQQRGAALPWVFFGFMLVAGFLFFTEHRAHLMGALPFLLLAACPLMHLLHGNHGAHRHGEGRPESEGPPSAAGRGPTSAKPGASRPPHQH